MKSPSDAALAKAVSKEDRLFRERIEAFDRQAMINAASFDHLLEQYHQLELQYQELEAKAP